jgi:Flp pilus assembly protein TadD
MEAVHIGELRHFFEQGGTLHMLNDTSAQEMDSLWRYACQLLQQGEASGARNLLQLLVYCDHWNSGYLMSLGVACQRCGAHQDACVYLAQAARILVTDPRPVWLLAQSAAELGSWHSACELYDSALTLANNRPEWIGLIEHARIELANCRRHHHEEEIV